MSEVTSSPTTALCAIMRNEGPFVLEWIAHHRALGFDQIIIYDNESTDDLPRLCHSLSNAGAIIYRPWPDPELGCVISPQILAYQHAVANLTTNWLCCLDADEFLVLEHASTIQEFLANAGLAGMPIALNWKLFGSSGAIDASPDPVTERFIRCGSDLHPANAVIKTFGPRWLLHAGAHIHIHGWPLVAGQFYVDASGARVEVESNTFLRPPCWKHAWINHYIVKSREEFERKRVRGDASVPMGREDKFSRTYETYFIPYDVNQDQDVTILRFKTAREREHHRLLKLVAGH